MHVAIYWCVSHSKVFTCKWEHQDLFCRNFISQKTCISNSTALTLTQPKNKLQKFWPYAAHCANEYAKEKEKEEEKNTTTLAIYHWVLLLTMGNYLQNDILL